MSGDTVAVTTLLLSHGAHPRVVRAAALRGRRCRHSPLLPGARGRRAALDARIGRGGHVRGGVGTESALVSYGDGYDLLP